MLQTLLKRASAPDLPKYVSPTKSKLPQSILEKEKKGLKIQLKKNGETKEEKKPVISSVLSLYDSDQDSELEEKKQLEKVRSKIKLKK